MSNDLCTCDLAGSFCKVHGPTVGFVAPAPGTGPPELELFVGARALTELRALRRVVVAARGVLRFVRPNYEPREASGGTVIRCAACRAWVVTTGKCDPHPEDDARLRHHESCVYVAMRDALAALDIASGTR